MRKTIMFGGALLVLVACSDATAPAPIHRHIGPASKIICPPGFTGMVIRTGNEEQEVCVPEGGQ